MVVQPLNEVVEDLETQQTRQLYEDWRLENPDEAGNVTLEEFVAKHSERKRRSTVLLPKLAKKVYGRINATYARLRGGPCILRSIRSAELLTPLALSKLSIPPLTPAEMEDGTIYLSRHNFSPVIFVLVVVVILAVITIVILVVKCCQK